MFHTADASYAEVQLEQIVNGHAQMADAADHTLGLSAKEAGYSTDGGHGM